MRKIVPSLEGLWTAVLCGTVDRFLRCPACPEPEEPGDKKKILLVRLDSIGDFILFLDTFKEYRRLYPAKDWHVTLLGNRTWADLAQKLPFADRYWFVDRERFCRNPFYRHKILRLVRKECFDVSIETAFSREFGMGDAVIRASGSTERIGRVGDHSNINTWQKSRSDQWYSRLISNSKESLTELERNAEFLRGLGLRGFRASPPVIPLDMLPESSWQSRFDLKSPYFVVFPGAGLRIKQWPPTRFAHVARYLRKRTGWSPVLCGGPAETTLAQAVISSAPELPWIDMVGETSLTQLARILNKARLCIGNDTSAIHLASAVGCQTVCVMGGGHFGRFFPYGDRLRNRIVYTKMDCFYCNWRCRWTEPYCLTKIGVDTVQREIDVILKSVGRENP